MAQLVAHLPSEQEVGGSSPLTEVLFLCKRDAKNTEGPVPQPSERTKFQQMLAYNPDRADVGMEHWSCFTTLRRAAARTGRGRRSPAFCAVIARPTPATSISMFIGGMKTYLILSQVDKQCRAALIGAALRPDAVGHRPWMWPLKYALPCPRIHAGDAVATAVLCRGPPTWVAYMPDAPKTQRHVCALVQTEGAFRVVLVLDISSGRAVRSGCGWPQGTVRAAISVVDGSPVMAYTRLHCGSTVTVEVMTSRSGKRHLYVCSRMASFHPLFVLQLAW